MQLENKIEGEEIVDTDQPNDFSVGQGERDEADEPEKAEPKSVVNDIAEELGGGGDEIEGEGVAKPATPNSFDISSLTKDQIQQLKQMLNVTPDSIKRKKQNPRATLRSIDGKLVIDWKNSYLGLVRDPENNRDVERHIIPVMFKGDTDYTKVLLSKFVNSERVSCEILSTSQKVEEVVEGEVLSRETGTLVDMVRKEIKTTFTIKLPDGETITIPSKMANA